MTTIVDSKYGDSIARSSSYTGSLLTNKILGVVHAYHIKDNFRIVVLTQDRKGQMKENIEALKMIE